MGKGGKGEAAAAAAVAGDGENMAAWLVAKDTLKIMPFKLPPLGLCLLRSFGDFCQVNRLALLYESLLSVSNAQIRSVSAPIRPSEILSSSEI
jgi:hypothetical protein